MIAIKKKIKCFIINLGKKHFWILSIFRNTRKFFNRIVYFKYYLTNDVDEKMVVFESFMGRSFADSPKALYNYMIKNPEFKDFKFVWFFRHPENYEFLKENKNTILCKYGSREFLKYYSKSKFWITNSRISDTIIKKSKQVYLQCWHGTPLKKLGFDIEVTGGNAMNTLKQLREKYAIDATKYTYMVSPSAFCTEKFTSAFNLKKFKKEDIIIETGYPRNDFLVNHKEEDITLVKEKLNLPKDKKIILYAPTWRDNQHTAGTGYTYKTQVDFDFLKQNLSEEYIILFRAHYFVANSFDFEKYKGFIYDVSHYDDINDLYIISDLLITDYSSVFFDYSILKRPIVYYMYDLEEYKTKLRDFYISLDVLPGNIVENEVDLIKEIENTKNFVYNDKYKAFNERFSSLEDGMASNRVVEIIKNC